jgi:Domain of unknown function (DUF4385)
MKRKLPNYYKQNLEGVNFREHPEQYSIGKGEQGVLMIEPYKSQLLPYWRFKTPEIALASAKKLYKMFLAYGKADDFVGMDMARKFLQMGFTRSRRYANHAGGKKYQSNPQLAPTAKEEKELRQLQLLQNPDWATNEKAQSAAIFFEYYQKALKHRTYVALKNKHLAKYKKS